jgi:hypothetical protein
MWWLLWSSLSTGIRSHVVSVKQENKPTNYHVLTICLPRLLFWIWFLTKKNQKSMAYYRYFWFSFIGMLCVTNSVRPISILWFIDIYRQPRCSRAPDYKHCSSIFFIGLKKPIKGFCTAIRARVAGFYRPFVTIDTINRVIRDHEANDCYYLAESKILLYDHFPSRIWIKIHLKEYPPHMYDKTS